MKPWVRCPPRRRSVSARLFCIPYAGGGASVFAGWGGALPAGVDACAIQLPGREDRIREAPLGDLPTVVEELATALLPYLELPFAIYGHSLGALLGFELARYLRRHHGPMPRHLFVSAHRAPQLPDPNPPLHQLPDDEVIAELQRLNGIPAEVLHDEELISLVLPHLRADLTVAETYHYTADDSLDCPISVFGGLGDPLVSHAELLPWRDQTRTGCTIRMLPGDHFFIHSARAILLATIAHDMAAQRVAS